MPDLVEVHVTVADRTEAEEICSAVLARRLAASTQMVTRISSRYWWRGSLQTADEWLVYMITTVGRFDELAECVRGLHSYEVPQILAVPVTAVTADFAEWVRRETQAG
ncbi:divalent-cation tolerance protein CutA [Pseudofrankia sp. DC12]|uniref:divalent-cation tolerance protein CutA n=1 Tax=Pseudofrankia sp. DC12 TaxID=683315 RepID=UPI000A054F4D|nr:divalent-cation tolerance protein CutA [Pseudofrankia sp. DC12]